MQTDVLIVGGGPAGIATAIAARLKGLRATVVDIRTPPIDKPCGEGLLPDAVDALRKLGIDLNASLAFPFYGFHFSDEHSSVSAPMQRGNGFGIRRTFFHRLLVERAREGGVCFLWGTHVTELNAGGAQTNAGAISCKWLVGADGSLSMVRRFARLEPRRAPRMRFGFRRHYEVAPWTDRVEVHWGEKCQLIVAPTGSREVCLSLFTCDQRMRLSRALDLFPDVARRLAGARPRSAQAGAVTFLSRARAVVSENVALVGDASCTVDGVAGQGLTLALQESLALAEAMAAGDLPQYAAAHRQITRMPVRMTRLLLAMNSNPAFRRKMLRILASSPALFAKMLSIHTGASSVKNLRAGDILDFGWRMMWA